MKPDLSCLKSIVEISYRSPDTSVKGLLAQAIRDDDPVIFCEPKGILNQMSEVPEGDYEIEVAGVRVAADASLRPMYDPKNEKIRR